MKTSSDLYPYPDILHDPVEKKICYYIRTSDSGYRKRMDKNQLEKNKGAVSRRVKLLTRIFQEGNLNLLNLLKTRTKKNFVKEQTGTNLVKNDNKLTGRSTVHSEYRICTRIIRLRFTYPTF